MAIDYLEIRDINRELIGIIDNADSIIWHAVYFGVGDFEIYARATEDILNLLKADNYVTRPNGESIAVIEKIHISRSEKDGNMITATGRFAKSILDRRIIYTLKGHNVSATILRGNVEEEVRKLVFDNAIACSFDSTRNMPVLELGQSSDIPDVIVDSNGNITEKQVTCKNLLTYSDSVLQEYNLTSFVYLDDLSKKLKYRIEKGIDRSIDNDMGLDPVIFSTDFDNISESKYTYELKSEKNTVLIGGEGEGIDRFYSLVTQNKTGLKRREMFIDDSQHATTFEADILKEKYPISGSFVGLNFLVNGKVFATLVTDLTKEYDLLTLRKMFPNGSGDGIEFTVGPVVYAIAVYGKSDAYTLTDIGYKAMLDSEGEEGKYKLLDSVYAEMLNGTGRQALLKNSSVETFEGKINVSNGNYILNRDFYLGDIVTIQDKLINKYVNVRITEITEVQDDNGYTVDVKYS